MDGVLHRERAARIRKGADVRRCVYVRGAADPGGATMNRFLSGRSPHMPITTDGHDFYHSLVAP